MFQDRPRILLVEDHPLIAMEMEGLVAQFGYALAGTAASVCEGLQMARAHILKAAVLDVELPDGRVWPVADLLAERAVPFLLATGCRRAELPERFRRQPLLPKPVSATALRGALRRLGALPGGADGAAAAGRSA